MISNLQKKSQAGFSLFEMMVVLILLMVIMSAVFSLLRGTIKTSNSNYELTSATQGLRNSQEYLNRDILTLGDGAKNTTNILIPTSFATNYLTARTAAEIDSSNQGFVSSGVVISDNDVPANKNVPGTNPATTVSAGTDRISFLTEDKTFLPVQIAPEDVNVNNATITVPAASINSFQVGEVYFISNGITGTFGMITRVNTGAKNFRMESGDSLGINQPGNNGTLWTVRSGDMPMNIMRVQLINYFVNAQQLLVRRVFGIAGSGFVDNVVAEHVTQLQFRYTLRPESGTEILNKPVDKFDLGDATLVRMIEPFVEVETAYPLSDGNKQKISGVTQLGVRNLQFTETANP